MNIIMHDEYMNIYTRNYARARATARASRECPGSPWGALGSAPAGALPTDSGIPRALPEPRVAQESPRDAPQTALATPS